LENNPEQMNEFFVYRIQLSIAYLLVFLTIIPGAFLKIIHWPYANFLLSIGIVILIPLFILTINDIIVRPIRNKPLWIAGVLLSPAIVGLIYLIKRDNLVETN
jgi:hypothetical protein